ncbi:MAG: S8 family serine peptidase [Anaerolineales bacterium]|nr:S8 family serine peptidase [Anaerolineales bacterium]
MRLRLVRVLAIMAMVSMMAAPVTAQPLTGGAEVPTQSPVREGITPADLESATATEVETGVAGLTQREIGEKYGGLGEQAVVILVQLSEPDLVNYQGGIGGLAASAATTGQQFNAQSAAAQAYGAYLTSRQNEFVAEAADLDPSAAVKLLYHYTAALNGVALSAPASLVDKISRMAGVRAVFENTIAHVDTDRGPTWIDAPAIWSELGGQELAGDNVVVGIIDTGLWSPNPISPTLPYTDPNPSFAADGSVAGGAYTFPFTSVTGITYTNYLGVCKPVSPQASDDTFICNDKVIGGYWYSIGGSTRFAGEPYDSPLDEAGHGSHTASTVAGNVVTVTAGATPLKISGVAPRARIIAYKACWEEDPDDPDDGGCAFVDTAAAVNQAILDGVHVINYSIGGGASVGADTDLAFLSARAAGIFVAASAGNDGPTAATVNHISPWVTSVAAMDHDRDFRASLILTSTYVLSQPTNLKGASATGAYTGEIILAPLQTGESVLPSLCNEPYAPGTFTSGEIVVCRRGVDPRVEKGYNVLQGGAGGYVLVNASANQGLALDAHWLPAVHLEYNATAFSDAGEDLVTYLTGAALASEVVTATITGGAPVTRTADVMASFSSRGPTGINIIKPDVAAPGTAIFAAYTPQTWENYEANGYYYEFLNGTSMAGPHTAGAGALLKALHPTWTPVRIQSALMTGGVAIVKEDGATAADPFDQGSGRLDLATSKQPGVVFDIPQVDYQDVMSGTKDIETLNYPSLANVQCVSTCTWIRTATSVMTATAVYTWRVDAATPSLVVSLPATTYTVGAGASQVLTITADVSALPNNGEYAFARLVLHETSTGIEVVLPVAVIPSFGTVPAAVAFEVNRNAGSYLLPDVTAIAISDLTARSYGLVQATLTEQALIQDTTGDPYDNIGSGSFYITETVPADAMRFVAEIAASTSGDIDLYVGIDGDSDGPELSEELTFSATGAVLEYVNIDDPAPGVYWVLVQNYAAGSSPDATTLATAAVPDTDAGNLTVTGPVSVTQLTPFDLRIFWDTPSMVAGDKWYGAFDLGTDSGNPGNIGRTDVDITRVEDDLIKTVSSDSALPGEIVTYTLTVGSNVLEEDLTYALTDTIPAGLTYVSGTVTGGASVVGDTLTWSGVQTAAGDPYYVMTDSDSDAGCEMPLATDGAYVDLKAYGIDPGATIFGDTIWFSAFTSGAPFNVWGADHVGMYFTDDGMAFLTSVPGATPWVNEDIPDADDPNNLLALLWTDLEVVYLAGAKGVTLVNLGGTGAGGGSIIEYDDVQWYGDPSHTMDMEVFVWRTPDNTSSPEILFAYDNISGTWGMNGTVGVENDDGTAGTKFGYNDAAVASIHDEMAICFDWYTPTATEHVITYQAMVDAGTAGQTLTNTVVSSVDNPGSKVNSAAEDLYVLTRGVTVTPDTGGQVVLPGTTLTYTLRVTNTGEITDTFDITVGVTGAAFTTTVPSTVGPLGVGGGADLNVVVQVPGNAADGASSVATVTATSQGDGAVSDSSVLTTLVALVKLYMPFIFK